MGAVRDIALAHVLGAGASSDAFWIAFTVPGLFRRFVADEGLTGALVPGVARAEKEGGVAGARAFASRTLAALTVVGVVLSVIGVLAAPALVMLIAYGFTSDPEKFALTASLTRWMFPFLVFVSLVSWCEGLLNHRGHFFIPKIAPAMVSAAMSVAAFLAVGTEEPAYLIAGGVLVGGVVQLLVCVPPLVKHWGWIVPRFDLNTPRFRRFSREMGQVLVIGLLAQVNIIVLRQVAALLETGSVTHYQYATRVVDLAQGAIAVGVGSALLPAIARDVADRDWGQFRADFGQACRLAGMALLPAAAILLVLARPTVSVLFLHGEFDVSDAAMTAAALQMMVPFMLALAGINIVKRAYFVLDQRNYLLAVGAVGVALTGGLGVWWGVETGVEGLAAALSISTSVQLVAYLYALPRILGTDVGFSALAGPFAKMALASIPAACFAWGAALLGNWEGGPTWPNLATLCLAGGGGLAIYVGFARLLGLEELAVITDKLKRRLGR